MKHTEADNRMGGIIAVNKPCGVTSHDVVNKIRRFYNTKRVGHTGTLDPMASGVLVLLVGRAAKACEYISHDAKKYEATLRLGFETDTEDVTGEVIKSYISDGGEYPTPEKVEAVCSNLVGKITQIPPMYSAIKVGGKKLYELAREGKTIERQGREVEIFSLECVPTENASDYLLKVHCSGGTYIRTLCADIGRVIGVGGVMATLHRVEASGISENDSHTLEEIEQMSEDEREAALIPVEKLFENCPRVLLPAFFEKLFRDGCPIYQKKISVDFPIGQKVRVCSADGEFFALGEVLDTDEGSAIKSIKIFSL